MKKLLRPSVAGLIGFLLVLAGCNGIRFGGANLELAKVEPAVFQVELEGGDTGIVVTSDELTATFKLVGPSPGVTLTSARVQFLDLDGRPIANLEQVTHASLRIAPVGRDEEREAKYTFTVDFKPFAQYWLGVANAQVEHGQAVPYNGWKAQIAFEAKDDNGHRYTYAHSVPLSISVKNITFGSAPHVTWIAPSEAAVVSGIVSLEVRAADDTAVRRVAFYANGNLVGEDTDGADGYAVTWDTTEYPDGKVTLKAEAFDAAGNKGEATIQVTLANDPKLRWVQVADTSPIPGMRLAGRVALAARVVQAPRGVERVVFLLRGGEEEVEVSQGALSGDLYTGEFVTIRHEPGEYELVARVVDQAGYASESAITVRLASPFVITSPAEGDEVGAGANRHIVAITVGQNGTLYGDLGQITAVEIYVNGELLGSASKIEGSEDVAYVYAWNTDVASPGHNPAVEGDRNLIAKVTTSTGVYLSPGVLVHYRP